MKDCREYVEQELGNKKKKIFLIIYPHESEILLDMKGLPPTALLCAMCDGVSLMEAKVGAKRKQKRIFISIDWAIEQWGGDKDLVEAIKKRKSIIMDKIEEYKKMVPKYIKADLTIQSQQSHS